MVTSVEGCGCDPLQAAPGDGLKDRFQSRSHTLALGRSAHDEQVNVLEVEGSILGHTLEADRGAGRKSASDGAGYLFGVAKLGIKKNTDIYRRLLPRTSTYPCYQPCASFMIS